MLCYKKLKMINICPMNNGGNLRVCAAKRSSRHMGQISELNNDNSQETKLLL